MRNDSLVPTRLTLAALTAIGSIGAHAAYVPYGVQQNVSVATVTGAWGWQIAFSNDYSTGDTPISTVFANVPAGSYVMYAARPVGAENYTLLAAAPLAAAQTYTSLDTTTTANGAQWYYNGYSMGFAGLGDTIFQDSADLTDSSLDNHQGLNGNLRLSWHTSAYPGFDYDQDDTLLPVELEQGWRAGYADFLNDNPNWERVVLYAPVPETPTYLSGLVLTIPFGIYGLRQLRRRPIVSA